jgi:hypothetical protein
MAADKVHGSLLAHQESSEDKNYTHDTEEKNKTEKKYI